MEGSIRCVIPLKEWILVSWSISAPNYPFYLLQTMTPTLWIELRIWHNSVHQTLGKRSHLTTRAVLALLRRSMYSGACHSIRRTQTAFPLSQSPVVVQCRYCCRFYWKPRNNRVHYFSVSKNTYQLIETGHAYPVFSNALILNCPFTIVWYLL